MTEHIDGLKGGCVGLCCLSQNFGGCPLRPVPLGTDFDYKNSTSQAEGNQKMPDKFTHVLRLFAERFGREDDFGQLEFSDTPSEIDHSLVPSGSALGLYFSHLRLSSGSMSTGGALSMSFLTLEDLEGGQDGWRWIFNGGTKEQSPDWKESWVVFAKRNGDALYVDTSKPECAVYGIIAGGGGTIFVADSLATFLDAYTKAIAVEEDEFDLEWMDEETCETLPALIDRIEEVSVKAIGVSEFFFG